MFEQWLAQLQHSDPAKRREAIIALGKLADPGALPHLAQRYKVESEPALRDLIVRAGKHIQQVAAERKRESQAAKLAAATPVKLRTPSAEPSAPVVAFSDTLDTAASRSLAPSPSDDDMPEPEMFYPLRDEAPVRVEPKVERARQSAQKPVSERDRERAQELLKSAFAYKTSGDSQRAILMLARALQRDPDIAQRRDVQGLAYALIGGDKRKATELVLEAAKRVKVNAPLFDSEIFEVVLAAVVLFLMVIVFNVASFYGSSTLGLLIESFLFGVSFDSAEIQRELAEYAVQVVVPSALESTPLTLLGTVFNLMIVYWIGTIFGGTGSVIRYLKVMLSLYVVFYLLLSIGLGMMVFGVLNPSAESLIQFGPITLVGAVLLFIVGQVYLTTRVQEFSFVNAIASVIAGGILTGIVVRVLQSFGVPV
jgi:hypothetical protein